MSGIRLDSEAPPPVPPASVARTGGAGPSWRYEVTTGPDAIVLPIDLGTDAVAPDQELVWSLLPAFDPTAGDVRDGFRAAAVSIDLVTEDGRRLLGATIRERDGTSSAAADRVDLDFPDQWNERRISLDALAGDRIRHAELVSAVPQRIGAAAMRVHGWIDDIRIERRRSPATSRTASVPTTRGSASTPELSRGLTQPLTGVPHGGIHIAPATDLSNPHWTYSWLGHRPDRGPELAGILVTRAPSIWIGDRGALGIRIGLTPEDEHGVAPEPFAHDDERAEPHRYRVRTLSGIAIDATATDHGALLDAVLPENGRVMLCAPGAPLSIVGGLAIEGADGRTTLEVDAWSTLPSPHDADPFRGYLSVRVTGTGLTAAPRPSGLLIEASAGAVRIEVGASQISAELARTVRKAIERASVAELADAAHTRWEELLATVQLSPRDSAPGDHGTAALIASDLYRLFLAPTRHDEDTPEGPVYASPTRRRAPDTDHASGRELRPGRLGTNNGFWDTYRTAWPAYALLAPAHATELLDGMLEHVRDGGWSPRWTAGTSLDAMVGTSLDVIAADLVEAGVPGIDVDTAYLAALRNATAPSADSRFGRHGMPAALRRGWVESGTPESVSWTLEGAISDAGAAVLARALARNGSPELRARRHAEARYLAHRARAYAELWDPGTRFFRPRTATGAWADDPFDPRIWGGAHTETNAWGSRFSAPHDPAMLADLFGGPVALGDALDVHFSTPETARAEFAGSYGKVIHEMREARDVRRGMWGLSNQPAHHVPWIYAATDRPWRADDVLADAVARMFRGFRTGQGYPGDEDNGEMSAWHLFAVIGFAPALPGSGLLLVTAPQLPHVTLNPIGFEPLEIRAQRSADTDRYIQRVLRDGAEWTSPTVSIRELHRGGTWEVTLGPEPVEWSTPLPRQPHFQPDGVATITLHDITGAVDGSDGSVRVALKPRANAPDPALLVLTMREPGVRSFTVETVEGQPLARLSAEPWDWARQARPFEVAIPADAAGIRVRGLGEGIDDIRVLSPA